MREAFSSLKLKPKGGAARRLKSERPLPTTSNCPATNRSDGRLCGYVMEPTEVSKREATHFGRGGILCAADSPGGWRRSTGTMPPAIVVRTSGVLRVWGAYLVSGGSAPPLPPHHAEQCDQSNQQDGQADRVGVPRPHLYIGRLLDITKG